MDPVGAVKPKKKKTTESSKTSKALGAAVQTGRIKIMEIKKSNKRNTHLEVEFNDRRQTVYVTTRLLANVFGIKVEDDVERRLRYLMPLTAEATLQGNKMIYIRVNPNLETSECASTSGLVAEKQQPDTDQQKSSQPDERDGLTFYSIKEVKSFPDKTEVSVEGKVTKVSLNQRSYLQATR
ncbi:uncharacterized protein LOC118492972 isoform X2 [Sander lucioperca]|uniref:uncharacterized protein LOC118492972 isoform X2 n=1 Tax=Sander lucioperca TaxID=283035 RepID=UPI001653B1C5|nr:uncharacterized protein LOC118492972 isoform X2 [Sander lucioperca]